MTVEALLQAFRTTVNDAKKDALIARLQEVDEMIEKESEAVTEEFLSRAYSL